MPKKPLKNDLISELERLLIGWEKAAKSRESLSFYDPKAVQLKVCIAEVRTILQNHAAHVE